MGRRVATQLMEAGIHSRKSIEACKASNLNHSLLIINY